MQVLQEVTTQLAAGYNQETINQLTATLQEAYEKLEKVVSFDELVQLITTVEEMDLSAYTSESVDSYKLLRASKSISRKCNTSTRSQIK